MFNNISENGILFTEGAGCDRNITCGSKSTTYVDIQFKNSEIVLDDLVNINSGTGLLTHIVGEDTGLAVDIFSFFGMICENKVWYVTKYPAGIRYRTTNREWKLVGTNGKYDGKKSKIEVMSCASVTASIE
ncbi:hypothetical protein CRE_14566 [Caenorhabditis remanei]|uniref:Uncharacterized protein n=1 Tax=Caenorhabditis remanei TaxID=31234 RepID=E3M9J8_CAERE|nr:hypothetical protein CRE_14566 [Caenorhabditis remanei]